MNAKTKVKKAAPERITHKGQVINLYRSEQTKGGKVYRSFTLAYIANGDRQRKTFSTEEAAKNAARKIAEQLADGTGHAHALSAEEIADAVAALRQLRQHPGASLASVTAQWGEASNILAGRGSLAEAARFYAEHLAKNKLPAISVPDLVREWETAKENEGLSIYYVKDTARRMSLFAASFPCHIANITPSEISAWLGKTGHRGRNLNNTRNAIVTLFSFARARGYLNRAEKHAAELTERVKEKPNQIGIYTPGEIRRILEAAPEDIRPAIAIAAFAGLRSAEIFRLTWDEVKIERGHIVVAPEKAKTAQRRIVPILPNLSAWLSTCTEREGRVAPNYMNLTNLTRRVSEVCKAAGVESKHNGLRHSFASYRLAIVESADKVALETGNSPRKLFTNYRKLVTAEEAEQWFSTRPEAAPKNVIPFAEVA